MKFAAYDDRSIYAVADEPGEAIDKARRDTREPRAQFSVATISDSLANWIESQGWDGNRQSFDVRFGHLYDTTRDRTR